MVSPATLGNLPEATEVKSGRGRKPGSKARVRATLPPEAFVMETVEADDRGKLRRVRVERDAQQIAIDTKVLSCYKEWVAAGKPDKWTDAPITSWPIEKKYADDALFFLHKAADFHGKKLVVGKVSAKDETGKPYTDGKVRIPFYVRDRKSSASEVVTATE
jgi:hypothetical protein